MKKEGCLREHKLIRKEWRDSYLYSILKDEYSGIKLFSQCSEEFK